MNIVNLKNKSIKSDVKIQQTTKIVFNFAD